MRGHTEGVACGEVSAILELPGQQDPQAILWALIRGVLCEVAPSSDPGRHC